MPIKQCIFTGVEFKTDDRKEVIADVAQEAVLHTVLKDEKIVERLITAILTDEEFIKNIARAVFSVPAKEVGLNLPGSIADCFRSDVCFQSEDFN